MSRRRDKKGWVIIEFKSPEGFENRKNIYMRKVNSTPKKQVHFSYFPHWYEGIIKDHGKVMTIHSVINCTLHHFKL